jgi:hypothetical protein
MVLLMDILKECELIGDKVIISYSIKKSCVINITNKHF